MWVCVGVLCCLCLGVGWRVLNSPRSWQTDFLIYFGNLKVIFSLEEGWRGFIQVVFRTVPHLYYLVSELDFIAVW